MIKLIVNADDYGMNHNCTKAIAECFRKQWISNATLMVNMPCCEEAVALADDGDFLDHIGLHLNFTEGRPLTDEMRECRTFCNERGEFNWRFRIGFNTQWKSLTKSETVIVERETEAQIKRYLELGLPIRHFDSHHHSHVVYRMIPPVFRIAERFGFKTVRRPDNLTVRKNFTSEVYYRIEDFAKTCLMNKYQMCYTEGMCALNDLKRRVDKLKEGSVVELMVHPMYMKDGKLDLSGDMSDSGLRPMTDTVSIIQSLIGNNSLLTFKDLNKGS